MSGAAGTALDAENALAAFEAMHVELDRVWAECFRVLSPGGIACINIGDATRTVGGHFRLFHNHARILSACVALGFSVLPDILWRKQTNAPNKFMGSGMLPGGAYVTYEHEYILVLRKGNRRVFKDAPTRRRSAYFWEERNLWFSDLWELKGARQSHARGRSAAFPLELPWRLIHMYSAYGDTVLDPFGGTGTTTLAAAMAGRNSHAVDLDPQVLPKLDELLDLAVADGPARIRKRLTAHRSFVRDRLAKGKEFKHHNGPHDVPVITAQEKKLELWVPSGRDGSTLRHVLLDGSEKGQ
jgi:DNA modification methylase